MSKINGKATRRRLLYTGLALLTGLTAPGILVEPAAANDDDPVAFVQSLGERAIALLSDATLSTAERKRVFRELLIDRFDMPSIGRLVMARYWRQMTAAQKDAFGPLFEDFVVTTYSRRLDAYSGEQLTLGHARKAGKKVTAVGSQVTRAQGQPVDVDWMLRRNDGRWYVIDVVIEGVSMVISQRSEFATVISQQGGIDGLIENLRSRLDVVSADHQS
jgi:phospholipid transport system substrate-binding protein